MSDTPPARHSACHLHHQARHPLRGICMLTLASCIWGTAFVAQRMGMDHLGPFAFNAARFLIGALVLLPLVGWNYWRTRTPYCSQSTVPITHNARWQQHRELVRGGLYSGIALGVVVALQQIGLVHTTAGKAGFITALYIVFVPVFGVLIGRTIPRIVWLCVLLAIGGMYLLCMHGSVALGLGDALVLCSAVFSAVHILLIAHFAPRMDGLHLSCLQFLVCSLFNLLLAIGLEHTTLDALLRGWGPILYTGVLSCGVGFTLQTLGQRDVNPVLASLILSLEAVFAVICGWLVLGEILTVKEIWGCLLIFAAVVTAQVPSPRRRKSREG